MVLRRSHENNNMDAVVPASTAGLTGVAKKNVRRCLFGRPKPGEVDRWLDSELEKIKVQNAEKWSYDFEADSPLATLAGNVAYEAVQISEVPSFYRPRDYKNKRPCDDEPTTSDSHRPITRSLSRLLMEEEIPSTSARRGPSRVQKQPKITNYMTVRKRRSRDQSPAVMAAAVKEGAAACGGSGGGGGGPTRLTRTRPAPASPFGFAEDEPRTVSPRKRAARLSMDVGVGAVPPPPAPATPTRAMNRFRSGHI